MVESKYNKRKPKRSFRDLDEGEGSSKAGKRRRARSWKLGARAFEDLEDEQEELEGLEAWYDEFESEDDR